MNEGIVYLLTNPAMPGMVKIGKTGREVEARLNDLYTTGVPLPFECAYAARVADMDKVEKAFHNAFGPYRVNPRREFFSIEPEQAIGLLDLMKLEDMTPAMKLEAEQVDAEAKASAEKIKRSRRPTLNFLEMGLPEGGRLDFVAGDHFCTIVNGRQVEHEGETWALSYLTNKLLNHEGPIRGTAYWTYKGKALTEIYDETYSDY